MTSGNDTKMEVDPAFVATMKAKTEAVYKAFHQAHQAMRFASRAIDELQAVMPQELQTLMPVPQVSDSETNSSNLSRKNSKPRQRPAPYTKVPPRSAATVTPTTNLVSANTSPGSPTTANESIAATALTTTLPNSGIIQQQQQNTPTLRKRASRSPTRPTATAQSATTSSNTSRREPPTFTPEQAALLDEFIKYFNLRVESTNIPQWKIGAEISSYAGNSIKMDQSTVSRMARRLGVPKSQTGVEAVKKWIAAEKARIAAESGASGATSSPVVTENNAAMTNETTGSSSIATANDIKNNIIDNNTHIATIDIPNMTTTTTPTTYESLVPKKESHES
ncbi:3287_t:CDS:2 [Ambispora gerdemannii]|uniref:3287_t:CDS:1 n=1 Tax=Ambispora gerdemannii TaxID=144530 RepID=A0A9N8WI12_9GLOM|nr:3287_t:CDS:2 [Ambispora gerdemannii]